MSRDDSGMTLTELIVAMLVFSIAIGMIFTAVINTMRWSVESQQAADASFSLRQSLAVIDRQVRSGNVLFSPEDEDTWVSTCQDMGANAGSCMRIFTQSNGDEKCVQWQVVLDSAAADGSYVLRSRSWEIDWQTGGTVSGWETVASNLALGTEAPFTLLGASTPYNERSLRVHLESMDERKGEPVAIDSSLTGRNTSYGYDSGQCTPVPAP